MNVDLVTDNLVRIILRDAAVDVNAGDRNRNGITTERRRWIDYNADDADDGQGGHINRC